ncbi:hypothetical protein MMC17_007026 [Xylographa soralifera]|nr:hypothetical protein [Xylographa soralifera]
MDTKKEYGKRLIVSLIDFYAANDPGRAWASIPRNESDISRGFVDVTYEQLANAINHASWWLEDNLPPSSHVFETLAYSGPKDLRYSILAGTAVKIGKQVSKPSYSGHYQSARITQKLLLPSPFATSDAQIHVLQATKCNMYLHAAASKPLLNRLAEKMPNLQSIELPDTSVWLRDEKARLFPYNKSCDEGRSDPWLIFHTSESTGFPKPITFINQMMTSLDAAETMPDADEETMNDHFRNQRWYTPLPTLHFAGMTVALQMTVFLNTVVVIGLASLGPATAASVTKILEFGNVAGAMMPPFLIEALACDLVGLERQQDLKYIYFAGAPVSKSFAKKLIGHVKLQPGMGTTEAGAYFIQIRSSDDWNYYRFRPGIGVELEQKTAELYELVFVRKAELERWQQLFQVYPGLDRFPTKDLFRKHPSEPNLWQYAGRTDDLIVFSHGEDLYASDIEAEIEKHPNVAAALIGGD